MEKTDVAICPKKKTKKISKKLSWLKSLNIIMNKIVF